MAVDYFLKIDGVPGESQDDKHKDWIEVLSFSWGTSRGGRTHQDFQVVKSMDKASPLLAMASCNGKSPGQAMFVARKAGSTVEYLKIKLTDVIISSYNTAGSSDDNPVETVTLSFGTAEIQVASQTPTGAPGDYVPGVCEPRSRGSNDR
ncbi:MAG TPA: type VI secretion system tube protein Hcp [Myxococcaceae bacterium]|nr:type VI secretion system tube protein Hcp [Myxococcaceae bacterium]